MNDDLFYSLDLGPKVRYTKSDHTCRRGESNEFKGKFRAFGVFVDITAWMKISPVKLVFVPVIPPIMFYLQAHLSLEFLRDRDRLQSF